MTVKFRLRTALLVMSIVCVVLGLYSSWRLHDVRVRQSFLHSIYERGGFATTCFEDGKRDGSSSGNFGVPPVPRLELGSHLHVERIYLADTDLAGLSFAPLRRFRHAFFVSVNDSRFGDNQLRAIAQVPNVCELQMNGTEIDDSTIQELSANAPNLEFLTLNRTDITDNSIPHLERMPSLKKIAICDTKISESGKLRLRERFWVIDSYDEYGDP